MTTILLKAPEGITDCSFGGENYAVVDGLVEIPQEAAEHLYQFGFENAPADAKAEAETEADAKTEAEAEAKPTAKRGRRSTK